MKRPLKFCLSSFKWCHKKFMWTISIHTFIILEIIRARATHCNNSSIRRNYLNNRRKERLCQNEDRIYDTATPSFYRKSHSFKCVFAFLSFVQFQGYQYTYIIQINHKITNTLAAYSVVYKVFFLNIITLHIWSKWNY